MSKKLVPKHKFGNYIEVPDKTKINKPFIWTSVELLPYTDVPYEQKLEDYYRNLSSLSDKDIADYYGHLQDAYNDYILGYGVTGSGTHYDPSTKEGREAILLNTNYALSNAINIAGLTLGLGGITAMLGITPKRIHLGRVSDYEPFKIGEGAEAMVYNNSPTTVGKISWINPRTMMLKNKFPNFEPLTKKGVVFYKNKPYTVFTLKKLRIPTAEEAPKYLKRLDKQMKKSGYVSVDIGNDAERVYLNPENKMYMGDIHKDNIGLNLFGRPKIIDFMPLTEEEYADVYLMAE